MKKIYILVYLFVILFNTNLWAENYHVYYGCIHSHTAEGGDDNKQIYTTPEEAYKFADKIAKLDFFSISPHNHMISQSTFLSLKARYGTFEDDGFVPLYGSEWGVLSNTGHLGTFMTKTINQEKIQTHSNQFEHMYNYFNWLSKQKSGFAILNHPETFHFGYYYNPIGDPKVVGVEVFNGPAFETRIDQARNPISYERMVLPILNRGWHVGCIGSQDNHMRTWGIVTDVRTGVFAPRLTTASIVEGIMKRRCFATSDKNAMVKLTAVDENGKKYFMGSEIRECKRVTFTVETADKDNEGVSSIVLYSDIVDNGELGHSVAKNRGKDSLTYTAEADINDRVFIAKVTQEDGNTIWSSPIWISSATAYQIKLNELMILKKELYAARKHLEIVGVDRPYGKTLQNAVKYLSNVHRNFSRSVYDVLRRSGGSKLRSLMTEVGEYINSVPIEDAKLLRNDIRRLAKQLYLNDNENEFIQKFLDKLNAADANPPSEAELSKRADKLIQAKNYDGAIIILDMLMKNYPENCNEYKMKMLSIYSMLEAYEMAQTLGNSIISNPNLDEDMAYDAYTAMGLAYKRNYSKAPVSKKFGLIQLSLKQYLQLLKDYPNLSTKHRSTVYTLIGDRFFRMLKLVKNDSDKEKYYINSIKYFNKALKIAKDPGHIVDLNEDISNVTLRYQSNSTTYLKTIDTFKDIISRYPNEKDVLSLYKNIGDLYMKLSSKVSLAEDKKEYLKKALSNYIEYLKKVNPRDKSTLYYELGKLYGRLGNLSKAVTYYTRVEKENFKSRKLEYSLFNKGICYKKMGKTAKAASVFRRLLKNFPNFDMCIKNSKKKQVQDAEDSVVGKLLSETSGRGDFTTRSILDDELSDGYNSSSLPEVENFFGQNFVDDGLDHECKD